MVRLFVFSLLIIVVALWVTFYLGFPADPGYLLIAFRNYTFETSLLIFLLGFGVMILESISFKGTDNLVICLYSQIVIYIWSLFIN